MKWLLVWALSVGWNGPTIVQIEFESKQLCEVAIDQLTEHSHRRENLICLQTAEEARDAR